MRGRTRWCSGSSPRRSSSGAAPRRRRCPMSQVELSKVGCGARGARGVKVRLRRGRRSQVRGRVWWAERTGGCAVVERERSKVQGLELERQFFYAKGGRVRCAQGFVRAEIGE